MAQYGLPDDALQTVYRAIVVAKLLYSAWSGFITASDRKRVDAFLGRSKRCGFCPSDLQSFNDLIEGQEDQFCNQPQPTTFTSSSPTTTASCFSKLRTQTYRVGQKSEPQMLYT